MRGFSGRFAVWRCVGLKTLAVRLQGIEEAALTFGALAE